MVADETRPIVHFTPGSGWMNDPLALTWRDGVYHVFFQYVPDRTTWAPDCRWGHATSTDLLEWTEHPPALEPGDGDDGIWSGSLVIDPQIGPVIFYTAVSVPDFSLGRIRTARPMDDDWTTWEKGDVVVEAPRDDLIAFRDPYVFRDGDQWRMFVGTAVQGGLAAASSYSSTDLETWHHDGFAGSRSSSITEPVWTGSLWECPQLFEIDGRHVLVTSVWDADVLHYVAYGVGRYADGRFEAESWHRLTYGNGYYAPSFFRDEAGRPCLIFWIRGVLDRSTGRASALSVPHLLTLDDDGALRLQPHPNLGARASTEPTPDALGSDRAWEVSWSARPGDRLSVGDGHGALSLQRTDDGLSAQLGDETIELTTDATTITLVIDRQVVEIFAGASAAAFGSEQLIHGRLRYSGALPPEVRAVTTQPAAHTPPHPTES